MIQDCMRCGDFIRRGQKINRGLAVGFECGPQSSLTTVKPLSKNLLQYLQGMDCWIQPEIRTPGYPGILAIGFLFPFNWYLYQTWSKYCFPASLCGVLAFGCALPPPALLLLHASSSSYNLPTRNLSTHNLLTHSLSTHNLLTHNLITHTTCSHTTSPHTTCPHTTCSHTTCHTQLVTATSTVTLRGRRGTWWHQPSTLRHTRGTNGTGLALVAHNLVPSWRRGRRGFLRCRRGPRRHGRASCVAGVGTWWHRLVTLCGRRGTDGTGLALVARLVPRWRRGRRGSLRGRRGTWRHRRASCVAGVGLGDIYLRFRWQAWHFWHFSQWAGFSGTLAHTHLVHTQLVTTCPHNLSTHNLSTYICCTCQSFTISFLFPAFPIPSLPFFCQLLEAVDMWGYPVLYIFF